MSFSSCTTVPRDLTLQGNVTYAIFLLQRNIYYCDIVATTMNGDNYVLPYTVCRPSMSRQSIHIQP